MFSCSMGGHTHPGDTHSTRFIPGWNSRGNRNFFILGWDFVSVTCKRTLKRKLLRANHSFYISKPLRKAIMRGSTLKSLLQKQLEKSFKANKKQKNFCCIKKKGNGFSIILTRLLLLTINYTGKRLNHLFSNKGN